MKKIIFIGLIALLCLMVLPTALAEPSYYFQQSTTVDLKIFCFNSTNTICDSTTRCQLTILKPDHSTLLNNASMTWNESYFNYTLSPSQTSILGEYSAMADCQGEDDGYTTFTYEITSTGRESIGGVAIMIGVGILALIFLYFAFNLGQDHFLLKIIFIFFALITTFVIPSTLGNVGGGAPLTILKIVTWVFRIFITYFCIYMFWHWIQKSEAFMDLIHSFRRRP